MNNKNESNPYEDLKRVFHEPKRLAIMSALCASHFPLTFIELKEICDTSDGNLHRHLKMLEDNNMIEVKKEFVDRKPVTTIVISAEGVEHFNAYIEALALVLLEAQNAIPSKQKQISTALDKSTATA